MQVSRVAEAVERIRRDSTESPTAGLILGTGLGHLAEQIDTETRLDFSVIPHFRQPTAIGHRGQLILGRLAGQSVVAMQGRIHAYEGHSLADIAFPVRVMAALGIRALIITNAAGGINPAFSPTDIMVIDDHIDMMIGHNPLLGINDENLGPRFPDMSRPYDRKLASCAMNAARERGIVAHRGVYAAVLGPNYETPAEYRFFQRTGADAVGMSTVPEVIVARHVGLRVVGFSVITNVCNATEHEPTDGQIVADAAEAAAPRLGQIVTDVLCQEC